jgi:hypothetical protein
MLHIVSICLYLGVAVVLVMFAARYLFQATVMPYDLVAMGKRWDELEQGTQIILLALMRGAGAGYLAVGAAAGCLVVGGQFRHYAWTNATLLFMFATLLLPLTIVMYTVRRYTPGRPPISASIIGMTVTVVAFVCEWLS